MIEFTKSFLFATIMPVLLVFAFTRPVVKASENHRSPAVLKKETKQIKSLRKDIFNYLVTVK